MDQNEPQKPKPTTDGTQMEGPAYSTRSKVKRTSQSEDDSSGSQANLPPPKRRARQGAKQRDISVGINNDDSAPIDSNTGEECTFPEIALRNRVVLESLLRYMNRSDLLSCRVINKQWQDEATTELRRRKLVIRLCFHHHGYQTGRYTLFQGIRRRMRECRTPSLLPSFQVKTDAYKFVETANVVRMLTTVGDRLKHLTLHLTYSGSPHSFKRHNLMTHLQNLIFRQAPNLEFLEINFDFAESWWRDEQEALVSSDRFQNYNKKLLLLPNLKTFKVTEKLLSKFFEKVINSARNLRSVGGVWSNSKFFQEFYSPYAKLLREISPKWIKYFLGAEGRDKIHLLKSLKFQLTVDSDYQLPREDLDTGLMERFLTEHKQNLKLESFECCVSEVHHQVASLAPRIVGVVNQILECSSGSLLKLRMEPSKWIEDLLIIPRLPELQEICFDCFWSRIEGLDGGGFFPRGFNMNNSFPNVSTIFLSRCTADLFRLFFDRMRIEITQPVLSIRRIIMMDAQKDEDEDESTVLPLVSDLSHVFPNLVSVSCVVNQKYYEIYSVS